MCLWWGSPSHTLRLQPPQSSAACPGCPLPSPTWRRNVPRLYLWQTEALGNGHGSVESSYQANHRWIKRQWSGQADAILTPVTPLLCSAWSTHTLPPLPTPILRLKTTLTATDTNTHAGSHSGAFKSWLNIFSIATKLFFLHGKKKIRTGNPNPWRCGGCVLCVTRCRCHGYRGQSVSEKH